MPAQSKDEQLSKDIAELASQIAKQAMGDTVTLSDKIEAFKVLANFQIGTQRVVKKTATESHEIVTFNDLKSSIERAG